MFFNNLALASSFILIILLIISFINNRIKKKQLTAVELLSLLLSIIIFIINLIMFNYSSNFDKSNVNSRNNSKQERVITKTDKTKLKELNNENEKLISNYQKQKASILKQINFDEIMLNKVSDISQVKYYFNQKYYQENKLKKLKNNVLSKEIKLNQQYYKITGYKEYFVDYWKL